MLQQCTGKVVRLNIKCEIAYSTPVVEFNSIMALVVLMEQCNFVIEGAEKDYRSNGTFQFMTIKGFRTYIT